MNKVNDNVRIAIFDKTNPQLFLVLSEIDDPQNFKLPGGKLELEETSDEAVERELLEELGISVADILLEKTAELVTDDGLYKRYIYKAVVDKDLIKPSEEIATVIWVDENNIPETKNKNHILAAVESCNR